MSDDLSELTAVFSEIQAAARQNPAAVLVAVLDTLIDAACGTNPALMGYMKLKMYRRIRDRLRDLNG